MISLVKVKKSKLQAVCDISGFNCDSFGYSGKHKQLPQNLRYSPQHVIYNDDMARLIYFKPSFDNRFVELNKQEITSIRFWNAGIHRTSIFVYNYMIDMYTLFDIANIENRMWQCKRESGNFLFDNKSFIWKEISDGLILRP